MDTPFKLLVWGWPSLIVSQDLRSEGSKALAFGMPSLACPRTPLLEVIVCFESLLRKRSPTSSLLSAHLTTYTCSSLWKIYFNRLVSFLFFRFPKIGAVLYVNKENNDFLL